MIEVCRPTHAFWATQIFAEGMPPLAFDHAAKSKKKQQFRI